MKQIINDKNLLILDIQLQPSKIAWYLWWLMSAMVGLICFVAAVAWWQWLLLLLLFLLLSISYKNHLSSAISKLSTRQIDGVWLLAIPADKDGTELIYQAYLQRIQLVNLGFVSAVVLDFYVVIPKKSRLTTTIFVDQLTAADYATLAALAKLSSQVQKLS
ncbi:hypothetical protein [Moraxella cuniculi]|uniref:Toxin CptA n=1 Tax=Moraxella cuniculi TaxID=34061 RepID=A0A448GX66_9GAMM|nr:hypothetical protein [Moraxella cuniculi]VEG13367.1 Uncharacterised protein [Moraxella cuniculi]